MTAAVLAGRPRRAACPTPAYGGSWWPYSAIHNTANVMELTLLWYAATSFGLASGRSRQRAVVSA